MEPEKNNYTILDIEEAIQNDPNSVIDFIFPKLNPGQLSYWKYELKRHLYTIDGATKILSGYKETILQMAIRIWAEKNYPAKSSWIVFKGSLFDGLCCGFYDAPRRIDEKFSEMFYKDKMAKKNINF